MEWSDTARQPRLLEQKKDKFWLTVGLCALTAALFFLPFYLIDGGFFHYAGDFNSQQISFYRYMNGFVKGAGYPDSAFTTVCNTFSWATDLGSGVMNAYSFYLYGSPFFWFSLLFPQKWLPYLMVPLLVLKFAMAGGGAYLYLRRYVKNIDYAVLGAVLYAFSGFTVYNVFFNHFVDVVALFPYLLWSLDEALYNDRRSWFAFWVAVNLVNNYFFFIGQVVFLAIYFICKLSAGDFRLTAKKFGLLAFESVLGVAMGSILLVPAVLSILQNPRTIDLSSGWGFLTYSKVQQYLAILVSWIMPPDSPYLTSIWSEGVIKWTSMSAYLPLCSLAGAAAYWQAKHGDSKKRIVGTCAVFALVPYSEQCVLCPQLQLLCPLVLYAGAGAGRDDRQCAGGSQHRSGQPRPGHQLADDRHGGLCGGAGKGQRHGQLVLRRAQKSGSVLRGAGLWTAGPAGVPRPLPEMAG